jgi:serine protease Do
MLSSGGGSEGLGFAMPARIVNFVYQSLRKYGHVYRTEIGAVAQTITPTIAEGLGLTQDWGVVIADVVPDGPSGTAGIKPEDLVLVVDDHPMLTLTQFAAALYLTPDQVLKIDVLRGAQKLSFNVRAILVRDSMDQLADVSDPMKSRIEALGIFGLDFDKGLRSLPDVRI